MFFRLACVFGCLGVVIGAFGAHGLKSHLIDTYGATRAAELLAIFDTGVKYHFLHAIALLAVSSAGERLNLWPESGGRAMCVAAWSWLVGIVLFSGSLYILAATNTPWLGAVTPFGGLAFIVGWVALFFAVGRRSAAPADAAGGRP